MNDAALLPVDSPPSLPLLRVSGLSVGSARGRGLRDVDLDIAPGEVIAVAGEPGAGKTTLVRCIAGDTAPASGEIWFADRPLAADPAAVGRDGIAVVWQDLALCDNLDVAGNILLGHEAPRQTFSEYRLHAAAQSVLSRLGIPIRDTTQLVGSLSGGKRQMVAVARALVQNPRLLVLDEPTASLGGIESAQVEELISRLREQGTAILLASRDIEQMFRMADRIVVLRHGSVAAELDPPSTHPDDLAALLSGRQPDSSARRQLTRLHGLADRLVSADPGSSLSLILSALGAALGTDRACIHVVTGQSLICTASFGFAPGEVAAWSPLPLGRAGGPIGLAAARGDRLVEADLGNSDAWVPLDGIPNPASTGSSWSVPVTGPTGVIAVITTFHPEPGEPQRDELDLMTLYAGYAANAVERDRLLDQVTARNRVLETIREMLQTLAGPVAVGEGLPVALQSLRRGLQAEEVALAADLKHDGIRLRAYSGPLGTDPSAMSEALREESQQALMDGRRDGCARAADRRSGARILAAPFNAPTGATALLAAWSGPAVTDEETALIEDAAHSLRLALEREEAAFANQEAAALRRSREMQRGFLSRLSHELRTPLTAIRGYASSLMQPDVTWDRDSQQRFLERIAAESARLGRLVDDLLDFSAIESAVMRLQPDWCDIRLVVGAAVSCLPTREAGAVAIRCDSGLPAVWADHDRLEQVFVNLLNNAFRHNPPGTRASVIARPRPRPHHAVGATAQGRSARNPVAVPEVEIRVIDDGPGFPEALAHAPFDSARRHRSSSSGAGLGLSIARGIVEAHGGRIELAPVESGTEFRISLPVEAAGPHDPVAEPEDGAAAYEFDPAVGNPDAALQATIRGGGGA